MTAQAQASARRRPAGWYVPAGRIGRIGWSDRWLRYVLAITAPGLLAGRGRRPLVPDRLPSAVRRRRSTPPWSHPSDGGPITAVLALVLVVTSGFVGTQPVPNRYGRPAVVPTGATR